MRQDGVPNFAGKGGLAAFGEFIRSSELGVPHVAVAGEEIRLASDGLVELRGRLGEFACGEEFLAFRFDVAPLLPERSRFEPAEAGVQSRQPTGVGQS